MATGARAPDAGEGASGGPAAGAVPLADRRRPRTLDEVLGQEHLTGPGAPLRRFYESGRIPSMIFWGPPGTGKTTLARILGGHPSYAYEQFSAVLAGVKEVRAVVEQARRRLEASGRRTLLFVDEIHRFNKAQQDAFLPHVESGLVTLIGATTENPSFELNSALLSRCRTYVLRALDAGTLRRIGQEALLDPASGPGTSRAEVDDPAWEALLDLAAGDARRLLNLLEAICGQLPAESVRIDRETVLRVAQQPLPTRHGDEDHYDWISALHKSLRGSDPHASVYWLARMLESGEDPKFIVRRLVVFASEDVGLADPGALVYATAAMQAVDFVGLPECYLALSELVLYLALAPKSNTAYASYQRAARLVRLEGALPVPLRLRNAPTGLMRGLGYGRDYRYPHEHPGRWVPESYLPERILNERIYRASAFGREARLAEDHRRRTRDFYAVPSDDAGAEAAGSSNPALRVPEVAAAGSEGEPDRVPDGGSEPGTDRPSRG